LKAIGFVPRQVASIVAWETTTFSLIALIAGVPLGLAGGRWAWNLVANGIGSASRPTVPAMLIVLMIRRRMWPATSWPPSLAGLRRG